MEVHRPGRACAHRVRRDRQRGVPSLLRSGQRIRLRHETGRPAFCRLPSARFGEPVRGQWPRTGDRATRHQPARRSDLGRGGSGTGRDVLFLALGRSRRVLQGAPWSADRPPVLPKPMKSKWTGVAAGVAYTVAVAVAYYAAGRLALFLAIPPGYATAVWPAAGVALVAILVFGYRVWPGILIGHFCVNLLTAYDISSPGTTLKSLALPLAIACGGTLQAVCGAALIRRAVGPTIVLQDEKEIVQFLALGGPVSCLISASIGQVSLYAWGMISTSDIPFSFFTWWVGDAIGVMVVAPVLLAWVAPQGD